MLREAIAEAEKGGLWCELVRPGHAISDGAVRVRPVDADNDGVFDYVQSDSDHSLGNNLLFLTIYSIEDHRLKR